MRMKLLLVFICLIGLLLIGCSSTTPLPLPTSKTLAPSLTPQLLSPHNGATNIELTPTLLWAEVPKAKGYELCLSRDYGFSDIIHSVSLGGTAYQVRDGLNPSTRYYWMVAAKLTGGGWSPVWTFTTGTAPPPSEAEIHEVKIHNYRSSYDLQGKPDPNFIEATFSWITNKPCFYLFEIKPVDFDTPYSGAGFQLFDVSRPLPQTFQIVEHSHDILLRPGALHRYELTVWDREKNSARREGTFQAEGVSVPAPPPPPESSIDDIFLSRWGHTYYNNTPRVSYHPLDIDKLLIQIDLQIPWQLCYQVGVFDCSEMTAYLEYMLERHGYTTKIAAGEVMGGLAGHAWVLVYNDVADCWVPIEATSAIPTLEPLFYIITGGLIIDYLKPGWEWSSIYHVTPKSEFDWWNSPYADQLVEASNRAKLSETKLPPLPEIEYPDLPPLPEIKYPDLPPLPDWPKP